MTATDATRALTGVRCPRCEATFFPVSDFCPRCGTADAGAVDLTPTGAVVSKSTVGEVHICEVKLDDGVQVLCRIDGVEPIEVGSRVRYEPVDQIVRFTLDA